MSIAEAACATGWRKIRRVPRAAHRYARNALHTPTLHLSHSRAIAARAKQVTANELSPDRLAAAIVENLPSRCPLHAQGCTWIGKHGEVAGHLSTACPHVRVVCATCEGEVLRRDLYAHSQACGQSICTLASEAECPYGCGCRFAAGTPPREQAAHRAACLLEPRKLLLAMAHLQRENERLTTENVELRNNTTNNNRVTAPVEGAAAGGGDGGYVTPVKRARRSCSGGKGPGIACDDC